MRSIGKLFTALTALADSVLSLAGLIDVATGRLRQTLALDDAGHVLEHSGAVIDASTVNPLTLGAAEGRESSVNPCTVGGEPSPSTKRGKARTN